MTRQLVLFFVIGGVQYLLDSAAFALLILTLTPEIANVVSRTFGAIAGYTLNGFITFRRKGEKAPLHLSGFIRFVSLWVMMTVLSTLIISSGLKLLPDGSWISIVGLKLLTELVLALLSFFLQKLFVYEYKVKTE